MGTIIWELIQDISGVIRRINGMLNYGPGDTPEVKAFDDIVHKILAIERDNLNALEYLYAQMTKDKPATEVTAYAREVLADYREQNKLIK